MAFTLASDLAKLGVPTWYPDNFFSFVINVSNETVTHNSSMENLVLPVS